MIDRPLLWFQLFNVEMITWEQHHSVLSRESLCLQKKPSTTPLYRAVVFRNDNDRLSGKIPLLLTSIQIDTDIVHVFKRKSAIHYYSFFINTADIS